MDLQAAQRKGPGLAQDVDAQAGGSVVIVRGEAFAERRNTAGSQLLVDVWSSK